MKTLILFSWFVFIAFEISRNYWIIKKKASPIYIQSFIIRAIAAILHGVLWNVQSWLEFWPLVIFQVSSFYLSFDLVLNLLRKKHPLYQGDDSGWLDELGLTFYLFLKVLCLGLLILSLTVLI